MPYGQFQLLGPWTLGPGAWCWWRQGAPEVFYNEARVRSTLFHGCTPKYTDLKIIYIEI